MYEHTAPGQKRRCRGPPQRSEGTLLVAHSPLLLLYQMVDQQLRTIRPLLLVDRRFDHVDSALFSHLIGSLAGDDDGRKPPDACAWFLNRAPKRGSRDRTCPKAPDPSCPASIASERHGHTETQG